LIGELHGTAPLATLEAWRPADQRYYVSNTSKFQQATGWRAQVGVRDGVQRLDKWLRRYGLHRGALVTSEVAS